MFVKYGSIVKVSFVNYFQSTSKKIRLKALLNPFSEGFFSKQQ